MNNISEIEGTFRCKEQILDDDFLPPEVERKERAEEKSCSWSMGMLMLKILTGCTNPLRMLETSELRDILGTYKINSNIKKCILQLLKRFSVERISLNEGHRFLTEYLNLKNMRKLKKEKSERNNSYNPNNNSRRSNFMSLNSPGMTVFKSERTLKKMKLDYLKRNQRKDSLFSVMTKDQVQNLESDRSSNIGSRSRVKKRKDLRMIDDRKSSKGINGVKQKKENLFSNILKMLGCA